MKDENGEHAEDMMETTEEPENGAVVVSEASPAGMMQVGIAQGMDLTQLERMMDLQIKWEANEARKAYYEDFALFKAECPRVTKDMHNKQYESMYSSLGNLLDTVSPVLGRHGFTPRYETSREEGTQVVTCYLTHHMGHSESATESGPLDDSGKKNPIQQRKSTTTYLRVITFEAVTGIAATGEANLDDDGTAGAGGPEPISEKQAITINQALESPKQNLESFLSVMKASSVEEILAKDYQKAMGTIKSRERQRREPGEEG